MVERTAHNGLVASSNLAKPIILLFSHNMKKNLNTYKLKNVKLKLKNYDLLFFFHTINLDSTNKLIIEQKFFKKNLKSYKTSNNSMKIALKNSIFLKFCVSISGSLCLSYYSNEKTIENDFNNSINLNPTMILTALKLNQKIYSSNQLKNLMTLNYSKNITVLNKTLKQLIKQPYYTIKS